MELIQYLNKYFYTQQELLDATKISEHDLSNYQYKGVMPKCSYKLKLNINCESFLGSHQSEEKVEYYAKGYSSWLGNVQFLQTRENVYSVFVKRYKSEIEVLKTQGHSTENNKLNANIDQHIKQEWLHFLDGTYGLCTKSGLPEDIAAKEFAICEINDLIDKERLNIEQLDQLGKAVNLLDASSALFAPHERSTSSRHRLVNEVRRKYKLKS